MSNERLHHTQNITAIPRYLSKDIERNYVLPMSLSELFTRGDIYDPTIAKLRTELPNNPDRKMILDKISTKLLGMNLDGIVNEAKQRLKPHNSNGQQKRKLLINSATPESGTLGVEKDSIRKNNMPIDITGAIEARNIGSAKDEDVPVVLTQAGKDILPFSNSTEHIIISSEHVATTIQGYPVTIEDIYYGPQGLLLLALQTEGMDDTKFARTNLGRMVQKIQEGYVVDLYNLDTEMQIFLLWLAKKANVKKIEISANSSKVATTMPNKAYYFPDVEEAARLDEENNTAEMLRREREVAPLQKDTGSKLPFAPGYTVKYHEDPEIFTERVNLALELHQKRYGQHLTRAKAGNGTDGGNQHNIDVSKGTDDEKVTEVIHRMHETSGDWVIESHFNYIKVSIGHTSNGRQLRVEIPLAPSSHIVDGRVPTTITLQILKDGVWSGNIIVNEEQWHHLVNRIEHDSFGNPISDKQKESIHGEFSTIIKKTNRFAQKVNEEDNFDKGLIRGGLDWGIAQLGIALSDKHAGCNDVVVKAQDPNTRPNGGEQVRALHNYATKILGENAQAVTINLTPKVGFSKFNQSVQDAVAELGIDPKHVKLIGVSRGWAQIGIIGTNLIDTFINGLKIEQCLKDFEQPVIA